jgi:hypothetical protein
MKSIFVIATSILLFGAPVFAGMTPEQMRKRIEEIEIQLAEMSKTAEVNTRDTIISDLRDLDRRRFESDLELARTNARREVILIRAKEEEALKQTENEVLKRRLDTIGKQRGVVQSDLAKTSEKVDAGQLPPQEVTSLKLQLIKLDEEAATVEYQMSGGGSRFSDALADVEVDLAGINAARKVLDKRATDLAARRKWIDSDFPAAQVKLYEERELLRREFKRITGIEFEQAQKQTEPTKAN